jgi:hypothetical protein
MFLEAGGAFGLFVALLHVVITKQYSVFVQGAVPVLATYLGTAALLYNRGRGLPKGPSKTRSLYAAERSFQALLFTLVGVALAATFIGWASWFGAFSPALANQPQPWELILFVPMIFVMWGYATYLLSLRAISREFLRPVSTREIAKRIRNAP